MEKYLCENCKHIFNIPTKQIIVDLTHPNVVREAAVCPFCGTLSFSEFVESTADVESVYIYELGTGPQTVLDGLLAQGYVIVNRYAKTYALEKSKAANPPPIVMHKEKDYVSEALELAKEAKA